MREEPENRAKSFAFAKREVWNAFLEVKANQGAPGVDEETIAKYEGKLKANLYKLWNRMSSGSYFPSPVRRVEIPKPDGGTRPLGIPTVADRIAQTVVKRRLEPVFETFFHPDSYGYRPKRSAHDALAKTRQRCWEYDWVIDLDIKGFFDNIDHGLLMDAVRKHCDDRATLLYIERWLTAPVQMPDGSLESRDKGTPQGGVVSPLLANLFLHYAFDAWMAEHYRNNPFERYADDIVVHCRSLREATTLKEAIAVRLSQYSLELHAEKTRIVYCKDKNRRGDNAIVSFDFLGYTFRPREAKSRYGNLFLSFIPALSTKAATRVRAKMREWKLTRRAMSSLHQLTEVVNPSVRGWIGYYGRFFKSALRPLFTHLNRLLVRWAVRKHKSLRGHPRRAMYWLRAVSRREPTLFVHWTNGVTP